MLRVPGSGSVLALDFDGVVLDTESTAGLAWQELFARHGVVLDDTLRRSVAGRHDARSVLLDALQAGAGQVDRDEAHRWWLDRQIQLANNLTLQPHVRRTLDHARNARIRLVVASAASRDWVVPHLQRLEVLTYFEHVACGDDLPPKPDPAVYLQMLRTTGAGAREVIAVEDSPTVVQAARAAGVFCYGLVNEVHSGAELAEADCLVTSLDGIWTTDGVDNTSVGKAVACGS